MAGLSLRPCCHLTALEALFTGRLMALEALFTGWNAQSDSSHWKFHFRFSVMSKGCLDKKAVFLGLHAGYFQRQALNVAPSVELPHSIVCHFLTKLQTLVLLGGGLGPGRGA